MQAFLQPPHAHRTVRVKMFAFHVCEVERTVRAWLFHGKDEEVLLRMWGREQPEARQQEGCRLSLAKRGGEKD